MIQKLILSLLTISACFSNAWAAPSHHSLDNIRQAAREYVLQRLGATSNKYHIEAGRLDPRLKLNQCATDLEVSLPQYGIRHGSTTVSVRCAGPKPWSLFVPVVVQQFKDIVVLSRPLQRGEIIKADDLRLQQYDIFSLPSGYIENTETIIGKELSQNLPEGAVLNHRLVRSPVAIQRGQMVTLMARNNVIEVRSEGKALEKGAIGERIRVKNLKSRRIVEGIIINKQVVDVGS